MVSFGFAGGGSGGHTDLFARFGGEALEVVPRMILEFRFRRPGLFQEEWVGLDSAIKGSLFQGILGICLGLPLIELVLEPVLLSVALVTASLPPPE
jgi:hypothetical protein